MPGSFAELGEDVTVRDPLGFADRRPYPDRLSEAVTQTGELEAAVCGAAELGGHPVVITVMDFAFMGGSMGVAVGEKVACAAEVALESRLPLVIICASGGARMQEGVLSLLQMARTCHALARLHEAGVLSVCVLTDPTFGGVTASFAMLGGIVLAESGALVGFAGPRVITQTIRQEFPSRLSRRVSSFSSMGSSTGSCRALSCGRCWFGYSHCMRGRRCGATGRPRCGAMGWPRCGVTGRLRCGATGPLGCGATGRLGCGATSRLRCGATSPAGAQAPITDPRVLVAGRRDPWEVVQAARHAGRPTTLDYLRDAFEEFVELHGDRAFADDPAIVAGLARLGRWPVVVVGHQKGHDTKELVARTSACRTRRVTARRCGSSSTPNGTGCRWSP